MLSTDAVEAVQIDKYGLAASNDIDKYLVAQVQLYIPGIISHRGKKVSDVS